jgi:predicted nucleic acid-binding protein
MVAPVVIDASVTAAWCFHDEATEASQALRRGLVHRTVLVPLLWHVECANLLLTAERRKRITADQAAELLDLLGSLPVRTDPETERLRGSVYRLATAHGLTVYDAVYLDLAIRRGAELATRDKALRRAAADLDVTLVAT